MVKPDAISAVDNSSMGLVNKDLPDWGTIGYITLLYITTSSIVPENPRASGAVVPSTGCIPIVNLLSASLSIFLLSVQLCVPPAEVFWPVWSSN